MRTKTDEWVLVGSIPVDSGQMMLVDPCYLHDWDTGENPDRSYKDDFNMEDKTVFGYGGACAASLSEDRAMVFGNGMAACSSTGFGDGSYDVYVKYSDEGGWGTRVAEMKIVFICDDEEDDY